MIDGGAGAFFWAARLQLAPSTSLGGAVLVVGGGKPPPTTHMRSEQDMRMHLKGAQSNMRALLLLAPWVWGEGGQAPLPPTHGGE